MKTKWHELAPRDIESELNTDLSEGLSVREARRRLDEEKKRDGGERSSLFVRRTGATATSLFSFFLSPSVLILTLVSLLAALFGDVTVGLFVFAITVAGALICGAVKINAQRKINAMHDFSSPTARVLRGGKKYYTDGRNVVKGDIILLRSGDLLTCDARIISSDSLSVRELFNTSYGVRNRDVSKSQSFVYSSDDSVSVPDAQNMLYAGSVIMDGHALCVAVETGSDVYLSRFLGNGELSAFQPEYKGVRSVKPTLQKISFLSLSAVILLSLVSIVTLQETSFVDNFMMLLSSVAMLSLDLIEAVSLSSFAGCIERTSRSHKDRAKKKGDAAAFIRDVKAIDTLTDVSDLVLLGDAALFEGGFRFGEIYIGDSVFAALTADELSGSRLLTYAHTYLRALSESGIENEFVLDGVSDALSEYIRDSDFDADGADLVIKSLYFSSIGSGESGFACAETTIGEYRVALTFDESVLSLCSFARSQDGKDKNDIGDLHSEISSFAETVTGNGGKCLYIVSEIGGESIFEGIVSVYRTPAKELVSSKDELKKLGVSLTVMLLGESDALSVKTAELIGGEIAYASEFASVGADILFNFGKYSVYLGFSADEYALLIDTMRKSGSTVATYAISDEYYDVMARADLAISCDVLRYSSSKYRESLYEKLPAGGGDNNLRCSPRTRLLSRMLVHRSHNGSGGLNAVINAVSASRSAYFALAQSLLMFAMLMSTLLPLIVVTVLTGVYLINSIQTAALALSAAVISVLVFSDSVSKDETLHSGSSFTSLPINMLKYKLPGIIARASLSCSFALTVFVLDLLDVFGHKASYTMPVFIAVLLTVFVEFFIINSDHTRRGDGRGRSLVRIVLIYAALLLICALITLPPFMYRLFPNGIGTFEFFLVPAYCLCHTVTVLVARHIDRRRKK